MDLFPDGGFVRLRSCGNRKYVHADADWEEVSLRRLRGRFPSLEAVWRVEHLVTNEGTTFIRLQSAAYGRYLSVSSAEQAPPGHRGRRAIQSDLDEDEPNMVDLRRWRVERAFPDRNYVRLRHLDRDLRANGRHRRWNTGVTVDVSRGRSLTTMMQWTVHEVEATPVPIRLPTAPQPQVQGSRSRRFFMALWRRTCHGPVFQHVSREIRHVRANDEGDFDQNHDNWLSFHTRQSVLELRNYLRQLQEDWNGDMPGFMLCIRPGSHGRLMPVATHLPRTVDPLSIVVFRTGSPAAAAFRYPRL